MKLQACKLIIAVAVIPFLSGCAGAPKLPPGSYLEGTAGYTKENGIGGNVVVHIPLDLKHKHTHENK